MAAPVGDRCDLPVLQSPLHGDVVEVLLQIERDLFTGVGHVESRLLHACTSISVSALRTSSPSGWTK